jgi:hypothetical protein
MRRRRFPTDAEVSRWIAEHLTGDPSAMSESYGSAKADQIEAASRDITSAFWKAAEAASRDITSAFWKAAISMAASDELIHAATAEPGDGNPIERAVVRQLLAAESYGVRRACPHVRIDRPCALICDPPTAVCVRCLPGIMPSLKAGGFLFDNT